MTAPRVEAFERRLLWLGLVLGAGGSLVAWICLGGREAISFVGGVGLAGGELLWLRSTIYTIFSGDLKGSKLKVLAGFFLRLLLIPLCLYAMIRFLFLDIIAAVVGFAVFVCSVFIEGVLEAFGRSPK